MIAELGVFCLIIALLFSMLLGILPIVGLRYQKTFLIQTASWYTFGQFLFIFLSYACLTICFIKNDFSVVYVLSNSSLSLPWFYKLCAVWGGHEGSMLLWVTILSVWMVAVSQFSNHLNEQFITRVLVVLGWLSVGLILFLLTTSNPFLRQFQFLSTHGRDLNPLLQDPGFLFHPPMLYMGYVGFSVPFAFAIATLWLGDLKSEWVKWTRPWTLASWCCLTVGITLGSWWAYRELGWGGWWFWDPVENASFMPWLVGTALIHSLAVSEKRQQFLAWTILLAITAFCLSLVGTFLVRSGVLTSVHAFAVDPKRGSYILVFLSIVAGGSLLLFALRAQNLQKKIIPSPISRESVLLLNNVLLVVMMLTVLMGTIYPLLIDGLGLGKLSVGVPYFNSIFIPLMIPLLVIMGLGVHLNWQHDHLKRLSKRLFSLLIVSIIVPLISLLLLAGSINLYSLLGLILAFWVISSTLLLVMVRLKQHGVFGLSQAFLGMICAHCGVAFTVIGIAISSGYGIQDDVRMQPGDQVALGSYQIKLLSESSLQGPNYKGTQAHFSIINKHKEIATIHPEKRIYTVGKMVMTDSAIDVNPFRDIYIALGEPLNNTAWSVRIYFKPFVRWIWGGGFLILLGGLLALTDRRYYRHSYRLNKVVNA